MYKILIFIILIVTISNISWSQSPVEFVRAYDISQGDRFFDIYAVSDGGYIMCGKANYAGRFRRNDMIVVRVDSEGELIWSETYGDGFLDYSAKSIVETDNGEFLSGGEAYNGENRSQQFMATSSQ
jgi:hypothetical protein